LSTKKAQLIKLKGSSMTEVEQLKAEAKRAEKLAKAVQKAAQKERRP
jgi:hypothetical protein